MSIRRRLMMQGGKSDPYDDLGYINKGKVFHLDGADFDGNTWVDRVGGITYTKTGSVSKSNGGVYLGGSSNDFLYSNDEHNFPYTTCTLEVVFKSDVTGYRVLFYPIDRTNIGYILNPNNLISYHVGGSYATKSAGNVTSIYTHSLSSSHNYFNGVQKSNGGNAAWNLKPSPTYVSTIGARTRQGMANDYPIKGLLYQIRIYNRLLTEAEILHNQQVDNERFNLGLDI